MLEIVIGLPLVPLSGCNVCPVFVARRRLVKLCSAGRAEKRWVGARVKERSPGPGRDLVGEVDPLNLCRSRFRQPAAPSGELIFVWDHLWITGKKG
jgi:hypothetical protein